MKCASQFVLLIALLVTGAVAQSTAGAVPGSAAGPPTNGKMNVVVARISFKGNTKFGDAKLLKAVNLHLGEALSPTSIKDAVDRLVTFYRSHGANLSVWPDIDPDGGQANVQFVIDEQGTKGDAGAYPSTVGR
jgi:hypothetical protein